MKAKIELSFVSKTIEKSPEDIIEGLEKFINAAKELGCKVKVSTTVENKEDT